MTQYMTTSLTKKLETRLLKIIDKNLHFIDAKFKHFSFIVNGNHIISFGWNHNFKTHPIAVGNRWSTIHSELHAILRSRTNNDKLAKYNIINIRVLNKSGFGLSKPCPHCSKFLINYGFRHVIWSVKSDELEFQTYRL